MTTTMLTTRLKTTTTTTLARRLRSLLAVLSITWTRLAVVTGAQGARVAVAQGVGLAGQQAVFNTKARRVLAGGAQITSFTWPYSLCSG
ncbi:hypothetical protein B0T26DRAFT_695397 [Lasiosphaeria miniovina]|uniref:Uncharacterized protein n=1 Tax=Lasiosphaeria miniovina TaxID=1954250 RepID=A0AA40B4Z5_9PEZI|nr:uncharacterized protein B0T26DRAFT_695397 [Lasiosphaeria miniovina]KAK0727693.1 hypothetical protein B0T26DRAFT_695397 [Lasiosphaeria miniovina]